MGVNSMSGISAPDALCTSTYLHVPQHRSKVKGLPGHSVSNKAATQPKGAGGTVGEIESKRILQPCRLSEETHDWSI
jgi:hypothetical protein